MKKIPFFQISAVCTGVWAYMDATRLGVNVLINWILQSWSYYVKLTSQDISTTPKEPKTERGCSRRQPFRHFCSSSVRCNKQRSRHFQILIRPGIFSTRLNHFVDVFPLHRYLYIVVYRKYPTRDLIFLSHSSSLIYIYPMPLIMTA